MYSKNNHLNVSGSSSNASTPQKGYLSFYPPHSTQSHLNQISHSNSSSSLVDLSDELFVKDMQISLSNFQNQELSVSDTSINKNQPLNKSQTQFSISKRRASSISGSASNSSNNQTRLFNSNRTARFDALASTIASVASGESGSFEQGLESEHVMIDNDAMDLISNFLNYLILN